MPDINAAIIGCGAIAAEHLRALSVLEGMRVTAYCDRDISRAQYYLGTFGGGYATDDPERIFADNAIAAVYICTYHDTHARLAVSACRAGKHVLLEKPMALTLEDGLQIGRAVEQAGVTLMTAFKLRYVPMVARAMSFLPKPVLTIAQLTDVRWPDDFWAQQPVIGGANVLSQGVHAFDLICHLNQSEPVTIYAEGGAFTHPDSELADTIVSTIRFANGRVASLVVSDSGATPLVSKFSFQMMDGLKTVHLHDRLKSATFFDGKDQFAEHDPEELGMIEENRVFIRCLREGTPPPTGWREGLRATTMALQAIASVRTGVPQAMPVIDQIPSQE